MNQFKAKLYEEFEDNAFKLMGVSGDRVREVLGNRGEDIDADFEAAWSFGGAPFMRQTMSMVLATLELVYHESDIGRQLTDEEQKYCDKLLSGCKTKLPLNDLYLPLMKNILRRHYSSTSG